jgi:ribosome-interacting GTPase 1
MPPPGRDPPMPTNVTPEFKRAKEAFQKARDPAERLVHLKEMLRAVPKHKGTEHLQADIKSRIKDLTDELAGPKKGGARTGPTHAVRPEGAAQIALVGPPNSGKSSLHVRLTASHAEVGPYPFTTHAPLPGMLPYEDVLFQLIDLPPIGVDVMEPWIPNSLQPAHAVLLVVDLTTPGCVENVAAIRERLDEKRITLSEKWPGALDPSHLVFPELAESSTSGVEEDDDPFRIHLPTLLVANKSDLHPDADEIGILEELIGVRYPAISVSSETGEGLDRIGPTLFRGLQIVRVYTKIPGHPADDDKPYTVFLGDTVYDVARLVHRDIAASLKFARIWGSGKFDGQQVGKDHPVNDGDVVELHA